TRAQRKRVFRLRSEPPRAARESESGDDPTARELAERLAVPEAEVVDMEMRLAARDFSLDAKLGEGSSKSHLDALVSTEDSQEVAFGREEERALLRGKVDEALEHLDERERYIVENRLMSDEPQTLQELGDAFKVSRERARQIETRVIAKLRAAFTESAPAMAQL
ncbi:MAG: sigma factor-like helix-turn-helix DNA-binding protein, partial [Myxococcota bacterium]